MPVEETKGSIFDDLIKQLEELQKEITISITDIVIRSFKQGTSSYFKKRIWSSSNTPPPLLRNNTTNNITTNNNNNNNSYDLSPEMAESLVLLRDRLNLFLQHINHSLFQKLWKEIATKLNEYILDQILSKHHFLQNATHQLAHDLSSLVLIFRIFTPKPETYLKE